MAAVDMALNELPGGQVTVGFRSGWVRHLRIALSSAGGMAFVLAVFGLLERQPIGGFQLLTSWGPWPVVMLVGLALAGHFLSRISDTLQVSFGAVVASIQQGAVAHTKTAEALGRLAEQGNRHHEEVERLTEYAVQELPRLQERLDSQDEMLRGLRTSTDAVCEILARGRKGADENAG
jgi:hypothetical protein